MKSDEKTGYIELPTSALVDKLDVSMRPLPPIDLFVRRGDAIEQIRKASEDFPALALTIHETVLVRESDFAHVKSQAERVLADPKLSKALPVEKRAELLRRSAMTVVDDLFRDPSRENIDRSVKTVGSLVYLMMREPESYSLLSKLSSHDPYTLQHSVGTAVHCIILAKKSGMRGEAELSEAGLAGLLHDIGKVKVRREIINKKGPLDDKEWVEMREHSRLGYEIVKDLPQLSERVKRAILEHHEDKLGTGYPGGVKSSTVDKLSRIVAVCDIFNALTTDRTYSAARSPYDAFQLMRDKLMNKIDDELFRNLVLIYGGRID